MNGCPPLPFSFDEYEIINSITFDFEDIGYNPVTLYVTDGAGNSNECITNVIVEDSKPTPVSINSFTGKVIIDDSTGACCRPDGNCFYETQADCEGFFRGVYHGDGSSCEPYPCEEPLPPSEAPGETTIVGMIPY